MRIQYCSDLHLEFELNNRYLIQNPLRVCADILILAGDIVPLHDANFKNPFFNFISDNYKMVYWVPGNHEYYHNDLSAFSSSYTINVRSNVRIVNNVELEYEGIRFVFSALWSKISERNELDIEQRVADFDCITLKNKKLRAKDFNTLHYESLDFVKQSLSVSKPKTVVVTHHLPSDLCNSPAHINSSINEAFCVDLTPYIESCNANFWIYGHSHFNQKPLIIGKTMLLTNQLGYVQNNEHGSFNHKAFFSL